MIYDTKEQYIPLRYEQLKKQGFDPEIAATQATAEWFAGEIADIPEAGE